MEVKILKVMTCNTASGFALAMPFLAILSALSLKSQKYMGPLK